MVKKNYHVSLDEHYVDFFKANSGLQLSKFLNDCLVDYVDLVYNQDYDSLVVKLNRVDGDIKESQMVRRMLLQQMLSVNQMDDVEERHPEIYDAFVDNKGIYNSEDYDELFKATGLRKSQLQRLTEYFIKYDEDDYDAFKNIDYAMDKIDSVNEFLLQDTDEKFDYEESLRLMESIFSDAS